jgi:hypothetical protein
VNQPWSCPSPGCHYRGLEAVHILEVGARPLTGHMTAADLAEHGRAKREAQRLELERDTVLCEAELPVELFAGLTVHDIFERVTNLFRLLSYSERLIVKAADGGTVTSSPAGLDPNCPTARLRIRWKSWAVPGATTPEGFWALTKKGYETITLAESVVFDFPGGVEVVLKHRLRNYSPNDQVPVRA